MKDDNDDEWLKSLASYQTATQERIASYKKLKEQAYKSGNKELIPLFKEFEKEEVKWLGFLRWEITCWRNNDWRPYDEESSQSYLRQTSKGLNASTKKGK